MFGTFQFSSVQLLSCVRLFATPWTVARQASLSIINSQNLLKLTSIELVMGSNHLVLCRPFLLPPSIFPSIRVFSSESVLSIRWPKYWSFSFSISPSNEYSGLISFRIDWFDLLAVQGTRKSLLQHRGSKASILQRSISLWSNSHIHIWLLEKPWRRRWHPTPVLLPWKSMDGEAWWAAVHAVAKSRTRLSDFTFTFHFHALEKEMAAHSSVLAWSIPGTVEPGGLLSMGLHRIGHDWSDLAAAAAEKP